jgi:hypothetical protein
VGRRRRVVRLLVRGLELSQHAVAQVDRVGEVLEAERVLREARDGERPRDRARCEHELLVGDLEAARVRGLHVHDATLLVQRRRGAEQQLGVPAHLAQGHDDVARLERARGRLGQHRRVEHEVLAADDRRAAAAEQTGDVAPRKSAADDENPAASSACRCHEPFLHETSRPAV